MTRNNRGGRNGYVSVCVDFQTRENIRAMATHDDRTIAAFLRRLVDDEARRRAGPATPLTGFHSMSDGWRDPRTTDDAEDLP